MCRLSGRHGTVFYCGRSGCQHDPAACFGGHSKSNATHSRRKVWTHRRSPPRNVDVVGGDSCARLSPYCSFSIVNYDISCGGLSLSTSVAGVCVGPAGSCPDQWMRFSVVTSASAMAGDSSGARGMTWTDERVETAEEAMDRRLVGKPDRRRARRHHAQRGDRQGAPARPLRPRKIAIVDGAASAQAASALADAARLAPLACAAIRRWRMRSTSRSRRSRNSSTTSSRSASAARCSSSPRRPAVGRSAIRARRNSSSAAARPFRSLPYCAHHSRVAYQPANVRRDRRPFR